MTANIFINKEWVEDVEIINIVPYEGKFMVIFHNEPKTSNPEYCIVDLKDVEIL